MATTKARFEVIIREEFCKGCGLCVQACPRGALELAPHMGERGFHPAHLAHQEACSGCTQCALMCPDACITIVRTAAGETEGE